MRLIPNYKGKPLSRNTAVAFRRANVPSSAAWGRRSFAVCLHEEMEKRLAKRLLWCTQNAFIYGRGQQPEKYSAVYLMSDTHPRFCFYDYLRTLGGHSGAHRTGLLGDHGI